MPRFLVPLVAAAGLLAAPAAAGAQQIGTGRTILATVLDASGRPQLDLGLDDFVVSEDGDEREVLDVHVADYPVALLIDDKVGSAAITAIKAAAGRFVTRIGERPVIVGTLASGDLPAALEDDRAEVLRRIDGLAAGVSSGTSALAAVAASARLLRDAGAAFSAIVIVAAGPIDATQLVQSDLLPAILESGATVHVVAGRPAAAADEPDAAAPDDLLRVLADQTHGKYTSIFSSASFGIALDRIADRLATELMVSYLVPPNGAAGDVKVGVRRPGAKVQGLGVR